MPTPRRLTATSGQVEDFWWLLDQGEDLELAAARTGLNNDDAQILRRRYRERARKAASRARQDTTC